MMMMMQEEECKTLSINDIDLSLLRLSSPDIISPLKRSSPVSDDSDHPKRRRLSPPQNPIFISSPLLTSPLTEKQETSPFASKTPDTEMVNNHVEATNYDAYEEINQEEPNYDEEEDCGEGMRIERSGDGFVIRLKCRCKLAFRVLFSDHHLYFKPL